jgi:hypothetical protein
LSIKPARQPQAAPVQSPNQNYMHHQKPGARAEYRLQESIRIKDSVSLAEKFQKLKSLTVNLEFFDSEGIHRSSQVKYTVNLANAKSVFSFGCPNHECVRGDFDLSKEIADAVTARRKNVVGEMTCQGWRNRTTIDTIRCHNILRFKFSLAY